MEKEKFEHEYALHLNILCKVKGICEAEKYFDSLPLEVKKVFIYGALLNCYCTEKMTDKALALFEKMDEMKYTNELAFSNLMGLFMKVDEPEKVPPLVEKMKRRNIPLSLISYQIWMHSYSCLNDLEGVEQVMDEAQKQENIKDEWELYCNFASAYVKAGQYRKAVPSLKKVEEILGDSNYPDRFGYHHLLSLYAGVGDLESVIRAWDKMKSKFPACNNLSYFTMLHILSKLDNIELLKKYFQDWNSKYKSYDLRLPTIVIGAYLRHDMLEEAELLLKDVTDRSGNKIWKAHALFMDYFLGKRQIDSALRHLEKAMANQWKPLAGSLDPFIEYLIEQKDVNNAEQFFHLLKKDQSLLSTAYLGLLQIYAAAGKIAPEMRERMEQDGANFGTEHEELLEKILDWMDKGRYGNAATDHALRINLMCKVKDIDEVEKYFDGISPDLKNQYVYGALLSCYCTKMMTDKALALFEKMDELNYASNDLTFSNLMSLYMKIGQPDKVPSLVEEMKQRNIRLTNHIYYIWIQSYRYRVNLEGLEQVMLEVQEQSSVNEDWQIHSNLAAVYIAAGQSENANAVLKKMEELFDKPKKADRKAYHFLISMYASTGDSESVYQAWHKLKSRFSVCPNMSYLVMLRALSTLDDIEGLKKFLKEWDMSCINYDDRLPTVLIDAYLRHNMHEEAKHLLKDAEDKAEQKIRIAHVVFMNYYLEKHNFDSALKHMEAAMAANWKPLVDKLDPFFEHFKEEKDVNGAEDLCSKLEEVQAFNSRTYLLLLQVYAAAGKTAPEMRQRMEENGIDIGAEHEELLQKIC